MLGKIKYKAKQLLGLKTRESLLKILPKNAVCAELGVFRGDFSQHILRITKPKEAHFIDVWWVEFGENYPDWGAYTNYGKLKTRDAYNESKAKIDKYKANSIIHVGSDLDYLSSFKDHHFDWVYIDSSHYYDHTVKELAILNRKMKPGGIISGHDWYDEENHVHGGVKKAIVEFCTAEKWEVFYKDEFSQWAIKKTV
ncbi:MAG: class I SAM-dependent methyltransferase [Bacteroidia bacterium]|nr:class I SAM-dependent methyltransferase [Bacteroidia bacterium]